MKIIETLIFLILFMVLGFSLYLLWLNWPTETISYKPVITGSLQPRQVSVTSQFYPNMRYRDRRISYSIGPECNEKKKNDALMAMALLSEKTSLKFYEASDKAELKILCSDLAPEPEQQDYFVAGEGGPTDIINTSLYYVILSGKISLFRSEKCTEPRIALHEMLHALGFDHNQNSLSIMYPVTSCNQEIDNFLIRDINRLYETESIPDLSIAEISANKSGRYLNFYIGVINRGLMEADNVVLSIYADNSKVKEFDLSDIGIGIKKSLNVQNLRMPADVKNIRFVTGYGPGGAGIEIFAGNNNAELILENNKTEE